MLVDSRLVGEGIAPHDRLVRLDRVTGQAAYQAAGAGDLFGIDSAPEAVDIVGPGAKDHRHLFEAGIAGSLSNAVDAAFNLARTDLKARLYANDWPEFGATETWLLLGLLVVAGAFVLVLELVSSRLTSKKAHG